MPVWLLKRFGEWQTYGGAGVWFDFGPDSRRWLYVGWQVQRRLFDRLSVGGEVFYQTATAGSEGDARFDVGATVDLTDGIKVFDERGWTQVLPDPDEPVIHIYAEGSTEEVSSDLEAEMHYLVEEIMQSEEAAVKA